MRRIRASLCVAALLGLSAPGVAFGGIHTWDVNEVFSNPDGTIQFVELWESNGTPGETGVGTGSLSSSSTSFAFTGGAVAVPTTNKFYLIGTPAFAALYATLPGAPVPDETIPPGSIVFFSTAGDTVSFVGFDSWVFGAVPTNGTDSLDRITGVGANTPTNYAGATGTINAAPSSAVPALPWQGAVLLGVLLGLASWMAVRRSAAR